MRINRRRKLKISLLYVDLFTYEFGDYRELQRYLHISICTRQLYLQLGPVFKGMDCKFHGVDVGAKHVLNCALLINIISPKRSLEIRFLHCLLFTFILLKHKNFVQFGHSSVAISMNVQNCYNFIETIYTKKSTLILNLEI